MKVLWDKALVKRLRVAVKAHSQDDWADSERMRKHEARSGWRLCFNAVFMVLWASFALSLPVLPLSKVTVERPGAYGLISLGLMAAGFIIAGTMNRTRSIEITPLINTPASEHAQYLYALHRLRREVLLEWVLVICGGAFIVLWMRLTSHSSWQWQMLPALLGGGFLLATSTLVWLFVMWLSRVSGTHLVTRLIGLPVLLAGFVVFFWTLLRAKFNDLPSPAGFGDWFLFLPQASLCGWLAGDESFPVGSFLFCVGEVVLAGLALFLVLRDRQPALQEMAPLDAQSSCTAEAVLAATLRRWRMKVWVKSGTPDSSFDHDGAWEDEILTADDVDEVVPFACDARDSPPDLRDSEPLQLHHDAPQEHASPVSPAFKRLLAAQVRQHLEEPWPNGVPPHLESRHAKLPSWSWISRWAGICGSLVALAAAIPGHLPVSISDKAEAWSAMVAMLLIMGPLVWYRWEGPHQFILSKLGWLPVDACVSLLEMRRWIDAVFKRRLAFSFVLVSAVALVGLLLIGLRTWFHFPCCGVLVPQALVSGRVCLPMVVGVMFAISHFQRVLDTLTLGRQWISLCRVRIRYLVAFGALLLLSVVCVVPFTIGIFEVGESPWTLLLLGKLLASMLVAEVSHRCCFWALTRLMLGRSDWKC